jgi:hypothetical protein
VTIATTAFGDLVKSTLKDQGNPSMALVLVDHPIAGRNQEQTNKLADQSLPEILKAATLRRP